MKNITKQLIVDLKHQISGNLVLPEDDIYNDVRQIWNAMIDRKPAVIVQCRSAADVPVAINFAQQNGLELTVRGAGHNIAGNSISDGGLLIDFSHMKTIEVDIANKRALVEPGVTLGEFDAAVQAHGLATPVGINSTTGIAGLTIGGGFGWLSRKYGMTVDNLLSVDLITVAGETIHVSKDEHPDLFWAIRGGGGNFGVITGFEYTLHAVGPEVLAGLIVYPLEQAAQILTAYRKFTREAPEELTVWAVMRHAPPLPFLPVEVHGKKVLVLAMMYSGKHAQGQKLIAPLSQWAQAYGEHIGVMPYIEWQQAFDPLLTPGARNYWKSHNFIDLSDTAIALMLQYADNLPTPQCEIFIAHIAGAPGRVAADAMAYGARETEYVLNVHARWDDAAQDADCISWSKDFFNVTKPFASSGVYVNFMTAEESSRVADAYGSNYARLVQTKRKYDPHNILHMNQNIKP